MTWALKKVGDNDTRELIHGFTLGRSERNHWLIDDESISRRHARFDIANNRLYLRDLHSANGVYVNGERIREIEVFPGDRIQLGESLFVLSGNQTTRLTVFREEGPKIQTQPIVTWESRGWRALARQFLKEISFLNASTCLIGIRSVGGQEIDESIVIGKNIELSSWLLNEGSRGGFLINEEQLFKGRQSLVQRKLTSVLVFPLGVEAFLWAETPHQRWSAEQFDRVHQLVSSFVPLFQNSFKNWVRRQLPDPYVAGASQSQEFLKAARRAAQNKAPILITGTPGVGKTLLARWIHEWSPRNDEACERLDLSQIPRELMASTLMGHEQGAFTGAERRRDGILETVRQGTLILENIDDSDLEVQTRLLKILEDKTFYRLGSVEPIKVNFRLVTTSRRDLESLIKQGRFRDDLFYRLSTISLKVPSLDDRLADIEPLVRMFVDQLAASQGRRDIKLDKSFLKKCYQRPWPGQIRELKNFIERALVQSQDQNTLQWPETSESIKEFLTLKELEKKHIEKALERTQGNKGEACKILGITRPTLAKKIADYEINFRSND